MCVAVSQYKEMFSTVHLGSYVFKFLRFHRHRHPVVSTCCFTGIVRVGVKIPQDENRANTYEHVAVVHEQFGARFAVFVRRARVLPIPCPATRNLSFLRFHRHRHLVVSTRCFTGTGTGWCENSTRWKSCKRVRAPMYGAWACLAHGLQCLCDGRACFSLFKPSLKN